MKTIAPPGRTTGKKRSKPKWQTYVVSSLFTFTLLLIFGFFFQEVLRWTT